MGPLGDGRPRVTEDLPWSQGRGRGFEPDSSPPPVRVSVSLIDRYSDSYSDPTFPVPGLCQGVRSLRRRCQVLQKLSSSPSYFSGTGATPGVVRASDSGSGTTRTPRAGAPQDYDPRTVFSSPSGDVGSPDGSATLGDRDDTREKRVSERRVGKVLTD